MKVEEITIYNQAVDDYCQIIRRGGNNMEEVKICLRTLEYFEDYEKCKDLLEVLKAYEITSKSNTIKIENSKSEKSQQSHI